jgi:2-oxoglutarate dehydrogenase E2 component (dihydrolipoamide succinyltransferase)|tara:strand:- start:116646 stop:117917 length:1272 start_codon:yes stop_codon:yes gene_type:complete
MPIDVSIPALGESVTEATVGEWLKQPGDSVAVDEPIVSLETDKVSVEVPSPVAGTLSEQLAEVGDEVEVGAIIARVEEGAGGSKDGSASAKKADSPAKSTSSPEADAETKAAEDDDSAAGDDTLSPAVKRLLSEHQLDAADIKGTGKGGRLLKEDVQRAIAGGDKGAEAKKSAPAASSSSSSSAAPAPAGGRNEERKRMSRLRKTIASRLKEAQNTAAMLTTFNDVDMTAVMEAREKYKDTFEKKHGVRLGFMSFFTKACSLALQDVPSVNAMIDGDDIVYRDYADIGIAVSSPGGLVVPILKNANALTFAETEKAIGDFGRRARDGELKLDELQGGTFTISNGGVFGSLMSTPILNAPQSAVLGMHRIEDRPVAIDGQVVIRPMMYLALSYDHRLIDGREAVTFLVRVKEAIEDPTRLVLDL